MRASIASCPDSIGVEDAVKEDPPSLDALTRAVLASRQEFIAQVTEAMVQNAMPKP